jgi:GNAT superfamily N-acetyltransferase
VAPNVAPIRPSQIRPVAAAIARGFQDNEVWAWVVPSARRRARFLPRYYEVMIRRVYLRRGEAWASDDNLGGALWIGPTEHGLRGLDIALEGLVTMTAGPGAVRRGMVSEETIRANHPTEPHYYLNTLSVDPAAQRRGHGSALMAPLIERCDAERMPAYLETQTERNLPYYRRFGFELSNRVEIPNGPPMWLMWREAR